MKSLGAALCLLAFLASAALARLPGEPAFRFKEDTFTFPNETVFDYHEGVASLRSSAEKKNHPRPYTRRCFVMSRAAIQFKKFARFDPNAPAIDDRELAHRVRVISRQHPWNKPWPDNRRIVFPSTNLRALSRARGRVLQENLGLGWPTYGRVGNWRMFSLHSREYQAKTHAELEAALARGEYFAAYLSTFPKLRINHAVLFYGHRAPARRDKVDRYWVYDPNHPEGPRPLDYSLGKEEFSYIKDWDFVGGFVRVYHIFGKPLQ